MGENSGTGFVAGLEDVVAAETRLSGVDGEAGELTIAGFPVEELAGRASFEETVYLLWHDDLPDAGRARGFSGGARGAAGATAGYVGSATGRGRGEGAGHGCAAHGCGHREPWHGR